MFNITRFLNVSAVVQDLDGALRLYEDLFGLTCAYRVLVPEMACDSAILPVGGGISYSLELVEPVDTAGLAAREGATYTPQQAEAILQTFLQRRGEGIYRLAFEVEDFDGAVAHLQQQNVRFTYYELALPTGPSQVAIVHPRAAGGVMFEFLPLGAYERGAQFDSWPHGRSGSFKRFLNTSCVVANLDATVRAWEDLFGIHPERLVTVPEMAVRSAIFRIGGDDVLEVFEPMSAELKTSSPRFNAGAEAALARFLGKRGAGPYRLAFELEDYDSTMERLRRRGLSFVPFELELETGPLRVTVLHPKHTNGIMFELCEPGNPAYHRPRPEAAQRPDT